MTDVAWWAPVAAWGIVLAAIATWAQAMLPRATPRWLPIAIGGLAVVPIAGLPVGRWLHGLGQTFSIPFLAVLLDIVVRPLLTHPWLDARAQWAAVWWGVAAAIALYPAALGLGSFDPYVLGWTTPGVATVAAVGGALLALTGNRFGTVLTAAGLAWHAGLLESSNAWDTLVDPVYGATALANLAASRFRAARTPT